MAQQTENNNMTAVELYSNANKRLVKDKLFTIEDMKKIFALALENAPTAESHTRMISDTEYRHFVMDILFNKLMQSILYKT